MTPQDLAAMANVVKDLTLSGLLLAAILGGYKRMWVFGWVYEEKRRESEKWEKLALQGTTIAERATTAARTIAKNSRNRGAEAHDE